MSIIEQALKKARQNTGQAAPAGPKNAPQPQTGAGVQTATGVENDGQAGLDRKISLRPASTLVTADPNNIMRGEEYRLLKERLLSLSREKRMNLFMVTSPMRNEGKTLVSCNLAMSLAHEFDHTVLLIDADLRASKCHRMLGIPRPVGLAECLLDGTKFWEALIHTDVGKLSFLAAGRPLSNPAELFSSNMMRDLLYEIKHRYPDRLILIDTAPLLPFSETRALSRVVDGVLLVARENVTLKAHLETALRTLEGSPLLGLVYNDVAGYGTDKDIFELSYTY